MIGTPRSWLVAGCGLFFIGCTDRPPGIAPPKLNPAAATKRALTAFDANGDGTLSREELKGTPGLLAAVDHFDQDGNGQLSANELTENLQKWREQGTALVGITCVVRRGGQPVQGATVQFVPEPFLGETIRSATGITGPDGTVSPSVADEELPEEYRGRLRGVHCAVYRVVVTHPDIQIPAEYNSQTTLGRLVTRRDHETLVIDL